MKFAIVLLNLVFVKKMKNIAKYYEKYESSNNYQKTSKKNNRTKWK